MAATSLNATPESVRGFTRRPVATFGWRMYGIGLASMGLAAMVWSDFITGQTVPNDFPHRTGLAYIAAAFLFLAGATLQWRKAVAATAAAIGCYYLVVVLFAMNGAVLFAHFKEYGTYETLAEQIAITAAALILYASHASLRARLAAHITRGSQLAFGLSAIVWGGAHFAYMNLTAPLVPTWLPPSQVFWGYLTGVAFIAAGLAIVTGMRARLGAILLTGMLASFTLLVHVRILLTDHTIQWNWTELAVNLALVGAAWVVADSFGRSNPG